MSKKTFPGDKNWPPWHQPSVDVRDWQSQPAPNFSCPPPNFSCPPPPVPSFEYSSGLRSLHAPTSMYASHKQNIGYNFNLASPQQSHSISSIQNTNCGSGQEDKEWVRMWLQKQRKVKNTQSSVSTNTINICVARQLLINYASCLNELSNAQLELQKDFECPAEQWDKMVSSVNEIKIRLQEWRTKIEEDNVVGILKKQLTRRALKRRRQQKKKLKHRKQIETVVANRQGLHMQIDSWRQQEQQLVQRAKREADTRREADAVLGEVRHKQSEGRRWQELLESLNKLRQLRAKVASDKGLHPTSQDNERFSKVTRQLGDLWKSQLNEYAAEEHALKVMLQEEAEVRGCQGKISKISTPLAQWENLLFGSAPDMMSKEFLHHVYAHSNVQCLLNIRREWDQFLVPVGAILSSAPPVGWVVPTPASSKDWSSLLKSSYSGIET